MPFTILRQDVTKMQVDAIVNAANTGLLMGGGVCGAVFQGAGIENMRQACEKEAPIPVGGAALTPGFALPCKFVIHAAGPVYDEQAPEESKRLLQKAYLSAFELALKSGCRSVAFPLLSSGIYGYPKKEALAAATDTVREFLENHELDVYLAVFDKSAFSLSRQLLGDVQSYIDEHYVDQRLGRKRPFLKVERQALSRPEAEPQAASFSNLADRIRTLDEPFNLSLLKLIESKGKTDAQVYKRANMDRKLFSKIRKGQRYMPGKRTVLSLAVALELTLPETEALLQKAGFAFSHSQVFDVIVEYFIRAGQWDIFTINEVLFQYDQELLGS